ncbi:MAG: hypothetical protein U5K69_03735 [Balneolaceae bacterium]|nr:hypothetical protein [Balneolaceae bacterium]
MNEPLQNLANTLIQGLKPALSKYVDRELDQFVEDVAQDALAEGFGACTDFSRGKQTDHLGNEDSGP